MNRAEAKAVIAALIKLRGSATDEQALAAKDIYPTWKQEVSYTVGDRILYNGILYKVLTEHTSQEMWTPTDSPSLFTQVLIPDVALVPEWKQPDSTNAYMKDDTVTHNGSTWVSLVDNNVWEPTDAVPTLWEKQ